MGLEAFEQGRRTQADDVLFEYYLGSNRSGAFRLSQVSGWYCDDGEFPEHEVRTINGGVHMLDEVSFGRFALAFRAWFRAKYPTSD